MNQRSIRSLTSAFALAWALACVGLSCALADDDAGASSRKPVRIKVLGFNDFHGQIDAGRRLGGRPVGGAAVLAAYLKSAMRGQEERTLIANAGDNIGASPLASALLRDEPTLAFLNLLGNRYCSTANRGDARCNLIGTPGNHEFDRGRDELLRQVHGGNHPDGPFLVDPWPGINHAFVSANIVDASTGEPLFEPYHIKQLRFRDDDGILHQLRIGFIGAVLRSTPAIVPPSGVSGLRFLEEASSVNRQVQALQRLGVRAIVLLIHQGGFQQRYSGYTRAAGGPIEGSIAGIVNRLDPEIDLVLSGHTHAFGNARLAAADGSPVLVTQAYAGGTAYADIDLDIDPRTGDVVASRARIVTTYADAGPGLEPDAAVAALVAKAEAAVAPLARRVVGRYSGNLSRKPAASGESALGSLIADAQRARMGTDIAFVNSGGIRADLRCARGAVCEATYADVFSLQPLGNTLVRLEMTGEQIHALLEQQFPPTQRRGSSRFLQVSGLSWRWDPARVDAQTGACRACILDVRRNGVPIDRGARYSVTANSFLADGGDRFSLFREATRVAGGPLDADALADYLAGLPQPFGAPATGTRIRRDDTGAAQR
jgi:5'-nucleotidase